MSSPEAETIPTATHILKPKRDKPVRQRHPWVFSGAIAETLGDPDPGDLVSIRARNGEQLAIGYTNHHSQIVARVLTWEDEPIDTDFWRGRLQASIGRRDALNLRATTNALRLVNAESDGLPGLVVDQYGDYLVMQCLTAGIDVRKQMLIEQLVDLLKPTGIIERSDVAVRRKEGLPQTKGVVYGEAPNEDFTIEENGIDFAVDLLRGHKTGFYLDQRVNRAAVCAPHFVAGKSVLNLFAYTGGFGVLAAKNGASSVVNIDSSVPALERAEANFERNGVNQNTEFIAADAFEILRHYRDNGQTFDVIIVDPPKLIHSQRDMQRANRAYKDLNWLAFRLLNPGGLLATFSCSGLMSADLFQKIVFSAVIDAGRDAQIIQTLTQSPDHPVGLTFPESAYLKGLLCLAN